MSKFWNILLEEKKKQFYKDDNDYAEKIVFFTSRKTEKHLTHTATELENFCKTHSIKLKIVFVEDAYFIKNDNKKMFISNIDDKFPFEINPKNTLIILRASVTSSSATLNLISQLEKNRFYCLNSKNCLETCADKFKTGIKLIELGLNTPKTAMVRNEESIEKAHEMVGGKFPVVLKTIYGTKGKGVFIAESWKNLISVLQTIWSINPETEMLIQEFIKSDGDYRIHVLNDKVIAVMKRIPGKKEFRANYSLGGSIEGIELNKFDEELQDLAIKGAKAVFGTWVGVDIIISEKDNTPYILEINSSPGTEGIELATKIKVAEKVFKFAINKTFWKLPTVTCGYIENVWIDGLGYLKAKFDTGNGVRASGLHCDKYEIKNNKVIWYYKGKKFINDFIENINVKFGGGKETIEQRPIIKLNVTFNGDIYKNISFCLTNRDNGNKNPSEILFNRNFMNIAGLNINPSSQYLLSLKDYENTTNDDLA